MADPIPPFIYSETKGSALTNLEWSNDLRQIRVAFNAFLSSYVPSPSILPTANGGTGANLTLNGNRIIISSGAVMAENAAITPSRAIVSDSDGLPTQSNTTAAQINFLSDVTGFIQVQIDGKYNNPSGTTAQYIRGDGSIVNFPTGLPPGGPAGGDLTGVYPNPSIGTNKVVYSKFQQVSGQRILGNPTGSTANVSEISLGSGLSFSGSQLQVNGTLSQWITTGSDIYYNAGRVGIGTTTPSALLDLEGVWKYNSKNVTHIATLAGEISHKIQNLSITGLSSFYLFNNSSNGLSINEYGSAYVQVGELDIANTTNITSGSVNWTLPIANALKVWTGTIGSLVSNFRIEQSYTRSLNRFSFERGIQIVPTGSNITVLPYNVTINDSNLIIQAASGNVVLPDTTTLENGHIIIIETIVGSAPTIVPFNTGTENIMGASSYPMSANQTIWVQKFPLNWRIIAQFNTATGFITSVSAPLQVVATNLSIITNGISNSLFRQSAALSVVGNSTNATANVADITAGTDFNILRRSGTSIGFGSIDLSQSGAVGSSILGFANGGTGSTVGAWLLAGTSTLSAANTIATNAFNITFTQSSSRNTRIAADGSFQIWNGATSGEPIYSIIPNSYMSGYAVRINPAGSTFTQDSFLHIRGSGTGANFLIKAENSTPNTMFSVTENGIITPGFRMDFNAALGSVNVIKANRSLEFDMQNAPNQTEVYAFKQTGGTYGTTGATFSFIKTTGVYSVASGSDRAALIHLNNTLTQTGTASGIITGIYYNPTVTALGPHRAWENVVGNVIIGSTSGNLGVNRVSPLSSIDNGGSTALNITSSSAASLTLDSTATVWVFTGSSGTNWTMTNSANRTHFIKNAGSASITLTASSGNLYTTSSVASLTINAGESYIAAYDLTNTIWRIM